jgi:hypothetical protein
VVRAIYHLSYLPIFNKITSVKSGNCNINNFLPITCYKGRYVTFIHYVQSISHNEIKQGLTSVLNIRTSPGGVMRICITADAQVSSFSPAARHQPLQVPGRWGFGIIIWKVSRSENNLPRPPVTRCFDFYCREIPGTVMHQRQYPKVFS